MIQTYHTIYTEKEELAPDVYRFRFSLQHGQKLAFQAGQYMILFVPQDKEIPARRLYSILTPPTQTDFFDLVLDIFPNGVGSQYLMRRSVGDLVMFQGPAGMFTLKEPAKETIFIATGTGIVPMKSIFDTHSLSQSHLLWGVPTYKDSYFFKQLKTLADRNRNFHFTICLSRERSLEIVPQADRKHFIIGRVTTGFKEKLAGEVVTLSTLNYYLCGGREVVESLRQFLAGTGIPKERVHFEKF